MNLEDRLAPGNLLGEALALAMPAQVMSLFSLPFEGLDSSAPTLANVVPNDAPPTIDPGVTLTSWIGPVGETFTSVATATQESAPIAFDPTLNDQLFASSTPTLAPISPPADTPSPSAGASGGPSASPMASSFSASSSPPPASSAPPPVVPPPGMNPPSSPPTANNDAYSVSNGTISVPASGVLANDTNPGGQPMTASIVASASHGIAALNSDGSFTYTTMPGYSGTDSFTYQAMAGGLTSNVATVTLTVTAAPPPVANNDAYTVNGGTLSVAASGVMANDTNPGGQPMSASLVASASHGMAMLNQNGSFTYTATTGYVGSDSFTYRVTAGTLVSNVATVSLTVNAPVPTANDDTYNLPTNGSPLVISAASGVLANDTGPTGVPLTAVIYSQPSNGTVALNADGSFTYTANPGSTATDYFTYEVTAGGFTSNTATVSLISPTPIANNDTYTLPTGGATLVVSAATGVEANDTGPTGVVLTALLGVAPTKGTVNLSANGSFVYTPTTGSSGADSFTYTVTANGVTSNVATVSLTVAIPVLPTASDDAYALPSGGSPLVVPAATGVLANDTAPTGVTLTAVLGAAPSNGTLSLGSDGSFTYTANPSYNGADSFTYTATGGGQTSNVATVTLFVGLVGVPDSYSVQHDTSLQTTSYDGVLANDSNVGGSTPLASLVSGPLHGTLSLNADGSFLYNPTAAYVGGDSFTYQAQANGKTTGPVLVSLNVTDQAPNAPDDNFTIHAGQPLQVAAPGLTEVATDPDIEDTLHFVLDSGPAHGQLQLADDGTFTYQANQGFVGTETFIYHTNDGALNSPTSGTVTIDVTDTAPLAGNVSFDMASNGVLNDPTKNVLSSTVDTDGDAVTTRLLVGPANASQFALNADGTFVYAPTQGFVGTDTFTFVANDGTLDSAVATVTINVSAGAMAHDHYYFLPATGPLSVSTVDGLLNDVFNPTSSSIQAVIVQQPPPGSGSVQVNGDGSFVYTPPVGGAQADVTFLFTLQAPGGALVGRVAKAVLQVAQPKVDLQGETFNSLSSAVTNGKAFLVFSDTTGKAYPNGWSATAANTRNPIAVVAGGKYKFVASFLIDKPELVKENLKKLTFSGLPNTFLTTALTGLTPNPVLGKDKNGKDILTVTWTDVPSPAKAEEKAIDQKWTIGGLTPALMTTQTAQHQIYVLAGAPAFGSGFKLFHTVARIGTIAAQGRSATNADEKLAISAEIVKVFQTLKIMRADTPVVLKYYGSSAAAINKWVNTELLLKNGDGSCLAWGRFFIDVLRGQGISILDPAYMGININPAAFGVAAFPLRDRLNVPGYNAMLVKKWTLKVNATALNTFNKQKGVTDTTKSPTKYQWIVENVSFVKTGCAPGQGNTQPVAFFADHRVVQIKVPDPSVAGTSKTILFDPSYGTESEGASPTALLLAWQNQSLDFVGLSYATATSKTDDIYNLAMQAITTGTTTLYVQPFAPRKGN